MNKILSRIIIRFVLGKTPVNDAQQVSAYRVAKGFRELKILLLRWAKDVVLISLGICSAAFGVESFLLPNKFVDGGATGISMLTSQVTGIPLYFVLLAINIPFMFLGYRVVGLQFAIKTMLAITGLTLCLAFAHFPEVTHDKLLVAVFGGFFLGAGIGLSVRGGAVIDGTEVLAIFLSRKLSATIGDVISIINILIFSAAAYLLSIEAALYSMITYLAASRTLDFVVEGIEEYVGVTIISSHSQEIAEMIIHEMGRGLTTYQGKGHGKRGAAHNMRLSIRW